MSRGCLRVIASTCVGPWGETVEGMANYIESWSQQASAASAATSADMELPLTAELAPVPGFIESTFNPLVYRIIQMHLESGNIHQPEKLAIILASAMGDTATADCASRNLLAGQVHNPLLFYQSVPNSILGYASRQFGFTGRMTALAHQGDGLSALLEIATLYSELPDVGQVLVIGVELHSTRADELLAELSGDAAAMRSCDHAVSLLLERSANVDAPPDRSADQEDEHGCVDAYGSGDMAMVCISEIESRRSENTDGVRRARPLSGNQGLAEVAIAAERMSRGEMTGPAVVYDDRFGGGGYAVTLNR